MDHLSVRASIEQEITWRENEIRVLRNMLGYIKSEEQKDIFRKALAVMLYGHFEGFVKECLTIYVAAINAEGVPIESVNAPLAASCFLREFKQLEDTDNKSRSYTISPRNDIRMQKHGRRIDFLSDYEDRRDLSATIPTEFAVHTEGNLKAGVFLGLLFRLGLPITSLDASQLDDIDSLVAMRNDIAHGSVRRGIQHAVYRRYEKTVTELMAALNKYVVEAVRYKLYLRQPPSA